MDPLVTSPSYVPCLVPSSRSFRRRIQSRGIRYWGVIAFEGDKWEQGVTVARASRFFALNEFRFWGISMLHIYSLFFTSI
jgi:hypothetical protein